MPKKIRCMFRFPRKAQLLSPHFGALPPYKPTKQMLPAVRSPSFGLKSKSRLPAAQIPPATSWSRHSSTTLLTPKHITMPRKLEFELLTYAGSCRIAYACLKVGRDASLVDADPADEQVCYERGPAREQAIGASHIFDPGPEQVEEDV